MQWTAGPCPDQLRSEIVNLAIPLIGFHGKKRVGKDYSFGLLPDCYHHISFADPIRTFADAFYGGMNWRGIKDDRVTTRSWKPLPSPREFMQAAGQRIREIMPDAFVNSLHGRREGGPHGIPDVRYANEAKYIEGVGGVVIGITDDPRGIHDGRRTLWRRGIDWVRGWFVHGSERAIKCDVWVVNDRGEDYECRLLEAIIKAAREKPTPS